MSGEVTGLAEVIRAHRRARSNGRGYACVCGAPLRSNSMHATSEHAAEKVAEYLAGRPKVGQQTEKAWTVEELDELPPGSYVQGFDGFRHMKNYGGRWWLNVGDQIQHPHVSEAVELPARILYAPGASE